MRNKIAVFDDYRRGDTIWFSNLSFNCLMRMELNTGEITVTGKFPRYGAEERNLHRRVFSYKNMLYFIPWLGKTIDIYDMSAQGFKTVEMPGMDSAVIDAVRAGDEIWIFPASGAYPVYVFDPERMNLTSHTWIFDAIRERVGDISLAISSVACRDEWIWLGIYNKNFLYRIDVKRRSVQEINLPSDIRIKSIDVWGEHLWITDALYPKLFLLKDGRPDVYYAEEAIQKDSFSRVVETERYKIVLPHYASYILFFDREKERPERIELPSPNGRCRMGALLFVMEIVEDVCLFIPFSLDCILCFDMKKRIWYKKEYHIQGIPEDEIQEMLKVNIEQQKYSGEMGEGIGWEDTLPIFMDKIEKHAKVQIKKTSDNVGSRIYRDILP